MQAAYGLGSGAVISCSTFLRLETGQTTRCTTRTQSRISQMNSSSLAHYSNGVCRSGNKAIAIQVTIAGKMSIQASSCHRRPLWWYMYNEQSTL